MRALIFLPVICALSWAAPLFAQTLIGKWLGQSSVQENVRCWVNHRREDGTYELTFLQDSAAAPRRHVEEGLWLHSNGLYVTITQRMNGGSVDLRDKEFREFYRIIKLDTEEFIYSEIATGAQFRVVKVSDSFTIGEKCPAGT